MIAVKVGVTIVTAAMLAWILCGVNADAAETFRRLSGSQIRATFAGMQLTDEMHWRDVYERDGTLRSYSMGTKKIGKWSVEKDELCLDLERPDGGCFEVWLFGKRVEMRPSGLGLPAEGVLETPTDRD